MCVVRRPCLARQGLHQRGYRCLLRLCPSDRPFKRQTIPQPKMIDPSLSFSLARLAIIAMPAKILVEKMNLGLFPERSVIGDASLEVEILINDLLDNLLDLMVRSNSDVFRRIDLDGNLQRSVLFQPLSHPAECDAVLGPQVEDETLVKVIIIVREMASRSSIVLYPCSFDRYHHIKWPIMGAKHTLRFGHEYLLDNGVKQEYFGSRVGDKNNSYIIWKHRETASARY